MRWWSIEMKLWTRAPASKTRAFPLQNQVLQIVTELRNDAIEYLSRVSVAQFHEVERVGA
jgi:hypothetical protein